MPTYTAYFRTDADYATRQFAARSPQQALKKARQFLDERDDELMFEHYDSGMGVNEIEIADADSDRLAVWYDDELRLRRAADDLRAALTALADEVDRLIRLGVLDIGPRWDLIDPLAAARIALAKAKGGRA
jgi:hypothetical protein